MSIKVHFIFWSLLLAILSGFILLFSEVLMPFVLGFAIAYLLNPLLIKMDGWGVKRKPAVLLILFVFISFVAALLTLIVPILSRESMQFIDDLPRYISQIWAWVQPYTLMIQDKIATEDMDKIKGGAQSYITNALGAGKSVMAGLISGSQVLMSFMITIFFTPIVAYFVMKEWVVITDWLEGMMPEHSRGTIKDLLNQINQKISGFIRGQLSVCAVLGIFYGVALSIAGLKYGFFIGLVAGVLSIIPMVGSIVGFIISILVASIQAYDPVLSSFDWQFIGIIAAIFIVGQILEGNFLAPKLIGDSVGLHPLWIMFSLLAGGALLGVLGMLLAIPVAAIAGVLISFAIIKYKSGSYYKNKTKPVSKSRLSSKKKADKAK